MKMKLIDLDELLKELEEWGADLYDTTPGRQLGVTDAIVIACQMPTVDAEPVIRCKDCLYWRNYCRVVNGVTSHHVCGCKRELDGAMHRSKANDFCSRAERKKNEAD